VASVELGGTAEPEIDWHEHQSCAVSDSPRRMTRAQLRRSYPRQHPRVAPADEPEDTEPYDQEAGADLESDAAVRGSPSEFQALRPAGLQYQLRQALASIDAAGDRSLSQDAAKS